MEMTVTQADDRVSHVALAGRMDHHGVQAVEHAFLAATAERGKPAIVEMAEVTFVVSAGLRMLLAAAKTLQASEAKMALVQPQPLVAETLRLAKLDLVFVIADSAETARAAILPEQA